MVCLEKLYQETGLSRSLFSDISEVSTASLKKYEWSDTDKMRKSTIEKIEIAARRCTEHSLKVKPLHFGNGWLMIWDSRPEGYRLQSNCYYNGIRFVCKELGLR
jgi:hypothetical protein